MSRFDFRWLEINRKNPKILADPVWYKINWQYKCQCCCPQLSCSPIAVVLLDQLLPSSNVAVIIHYVFCVVNPFYIIYGGFYFIQRVMYFFSLSTKVVQILSTCWLPNAFCFIINNSFFLSNECILKACILFLKIALWTIFKTHQ